MSRKSETHLGAARRHGRKALGELRRMTADSALYWVLAHRSRVAQFKRSFDYRHDDDVPRRRRRPGSPG